MKTFMNKLKKLLTKNKVITSVVTFAAVAGITATAIAAWGPGRPTYDYNKLPLNGKTCTAADDAQYNRCGSLTGPVFNSFVNTDSYGDERNFVAVSPAGKGTYSENLTANVGDEVDVRIYVHNNANQDTNASGVGVATNTMVRAYLPEGVADGFDIAGYVSASNAKPGRVYDTARVNGNGQKIGLAYESATIYNKGPWVNGMALPAAIAGADGTKIGYDALNGKLPGCFDYRAIIIVRVKITGPKMQLTKQVTTPGSAAWGEALAVKQGDTTSWLLTYKNVGSAKATNITLRDVIPAGLELVPHSIAWIDQFHPEPGEIEADTVLNSGGLNIGDALPNGGGYIRFRTVVKRDTHICNITNVAHLISTETPDISDTAKVTVTDCTPPTTPVVRCDALTAPKLNLVEGESTLFTASATAVATSISGYTFKVNNQVVKDSNSASDNTYMFTRNTAGTYTVSVTAKSPIGNVTSAGCTKTVTVTHIDTPFYTCDALTFNKTSLLVGEKLTASLKYTALNGASFKQATFKFGDDAQFTTNNSTNNVVTAEHTYAAKGTYAVTVKLDFTVNGQTKTIEGGNCVGQITVTTTTPPTEIPDTGAGSMIALFAGITTAGAFLHNMLSRRSLNK